MDIKDVVQLAKNIGVNIDTFKINNESYIEFKSILKWGFSGEIIKSSNTNKIELLFEELQELNTTKKDIRKKKPIVTKKDIADLMYLSEK